MKVIIDIPEDDYKLACNYPDALIACYAHYIKEGTVLPNNHGRLIDADKLIEKLSAGLDNPEELPVISIGTVMRMIDGEEEIHTSQPEIIRCKDCENWDTTWQNDSAPNYHYCPMIDGMYSSDFYCAKAERRTDATN